MEPLPMGRFISKLVKQTLKSVIKKAFPDVKGDVLLQNPPKGQFDYVSPSALKEFNVNKNKKEGTSFGCKTVQEFAAKIAQSLEQNDVIGSISVNQQGFLQIKLKDSLVEKQINSMINNLDYPEVIKERVVVDFSSPNIAKEMHVGHLRSTIIGQSICRVLDYMGHEVTRANHLGDWGTQFGMLIAYMREQFPDYQDKMPQIKDLDGYYKAARKRFDSDPAFKKLSQQTVVKLQAYDESCIKAWKKICQVSKEYFSMIYKRLGVQIQEYGESFYNPFIPAMLQQLHQKKLIQEDNTVTKKGFKEEKKKEGKKQKKQAKQEIKKQQIKKQEVKEKQEKQENQEIDMPVQQGKKAQCIFLEKFPIPLIVVKSDGGYNYDTTDMAAIKYRLQTAKFQRAIYITDLGQEQHFLMIFEGAKKAGWLTNQRVEHMGFGVVLGEDGKKFSTRKGVSVKLMDLINQSKEKALLQLKSREKDQTVQKDQKAKQQIYTTLKPEQYQQSAQKLGIASIKYFDLKQNRTSDYIFDFDKMLDPKGNTAVYLIYAYVRICSIIRKSGLTSSQIRQIAKKKQFIITHPDEKILASMLIKFFDVVNQSSEELAINRITDFIYDICVKVQENYKKYRIVGDQHMETRIILCEVIRSVLEKAFYIVGIIPIDKI